MQKHNRQMFYSLYISALAGSDTVLLILGEYGLSSQYQWSKGFFQKCLSSVHKVLSGRL